MRIGIVAQKVGLNDGMGRVNYEIAAEAVRQGHEVVLFSEEVDGDMLSRRGVRAELLPADWLPTRLLKDLLFAFRMNRRLSPAAAGASQAPLRRCDAVLANGFVTWDEADVNIAHFVHTFWRDSPHHPWRQRRTPYTLYRRLLTDVGAALERGAFRRSRAIVAVSNKLRADLIEMGLPSSAITTIANGVDTQEFRPGPAHRERFGLPQTPLIALFAGDLKDARKNLDTVCRALVDVPGLHLAVAGRHEHTAWPRLAAELGIADRVHFLGFVRDMPELMRAVDLFVFPSRYEPFGLVFLEALASGLPVVTARSAGGAELVTPQVGIVLDDCEDAAALTQALLVMISSDERRRVMGRSARSLALECSWRDMAARYLTLLEAAARNRRVA